MEKTKRRATIHLTHSAASLRACDACRCVSIHCRTHTIHLLSLSLPLQLPFNHFFSSSHSSRTSFLVHCVSCFNTHTTGLRLRLLNYIHSYTTSFLISFWTWFFSVRNNCCFTECTHTHSLICTTHTIVNETVSPSPNPLSSMERRPLLSLVLSQAATRAVCYIRPLSFAGTASETIRKSMRSHTKTFSFRTRNKNFIDDCRTLCLFYSRWIFFCLFVLWHFGTTILSNSNERLCDGYQWILVPKWSF